MSGRREVVKSIEECEKKREYDKHVDPVNMDIAIRVGDDYPYIHRPFLLACRHLFERTFIVKPFTFYMNQFKLKTVTDGKKNMRGIKSAVVTCNHVNIWDCLTLIRAFHGHNLHITAASFNNMKGFLGQMMRASRLMPLSETPGGMKNFIRSVNYLLKHRSYVVFYPEQAMWWNYRKPRPHKDGAYHFAISNHVPIIPTFITFEESGKKDEEGFDIPYFRLHIMKPIYPDPTISKAENTVQMKHQNYLQIKEVYEKAYGIPLQTDWMDEELASTK